MPDAYLGGMTRWYDNSCLSGWNVPVALDLKRWIGFGELKGMTISKADEFRLQAKKCLDQAEIAPDDLIKKRMRWLADEWLRMAFEAALQEDVTQPGGGRESSKPKPD